MFKKLNLTWWGVEETARGNGVVTAFASEPLPTAYNPHVAKSNREPSLLLSAAMVLFFACGNSEAPRTENTPPPNAWGGAGQAGSTSKGGLGASTASGGNGGAAGHPDPSHWGW